MNNAIDALRSSAHPMVLKAAGIYDSWQTLWRKLATSQGINVVLKREDGKTLLLRKTSHSEPHQKSIYQAIKMTLTHFGQTKKQIFNLSSANS